ncbi:MAG: hypothetical protein K2W95_27330 [Candidatus Obscuribacterales bacterium]|nr:hypothetical protein [Candidatus Obscuribacterales bacterium]
MAVFNSQTTSALALFLALTASAVLPTSSAAQKLQGGVQQDDFRIRRNAGGSTSGRSAAEPSLRLQRPQSGNTAASPVDDLAFTAPMQGKADANQSKPLVESAEFANLPKGFDIGAERNSKEMALAWERWHKQFAGAVYSVWNRRAKTPGRAVVKITVYRNRVIVPELLSIRGGPEFRHTLTSVFEDLNGNPGLTFPAKSERDKVSFEAQYIADTDVDPGYSWLKNDVEKIRQDN